MERPSTHLLIFHLLRDWHCVWLFVGRDLGNNQLKDLSEGIFRNNTNLGYLWVDPFIWLNINIPKFLMSQSESVSSVPISRDIKSLTWYDYDIILIWPNFGAVDT